MIVDFQADPSRYRHWKLVLDGAVAELVMDVDEHSGLFDGIPLKLNSYDIGVDIELYDATQRLRFEHPGVKAVVLRSGKDRVFCSGANIRMGSRRWCCVPARTGCSAPAPTSACWRSPAMATFE